MNKDTLFELLFGGSDEQVLKLIVKIKDLPAFSASIIELVHLRQRSAVDAITKLIEGNIQVIPQDVPVFFQVDEKVLNALVDEIDAIAPLVNGAEWVKVPKQLAAWTGILTLKPDWRTIVHYAALRIGSAKGQDKFDMDRMLGNGFVGNQTYEIDLSKLIGNYESFLHPSTRRQIVSVKLNNL